MVGLKSKIMLLVLMWHVTLGGQEKVTSIRWGSPHLNHLYFELICTTILLLTTCWRFWFWQYLKDIQLLAMFYSYNFSDCPKQLQVSQHQIGSPIVILCA